MCVHIMFYYSNNDSMDNSCLRKLDTYFEITTTGPMVDHWLKG